MEMGITEKKKQHDDNFKLIPPHIQALLDREFDVHNEPPNIDYKLVKHQEDFKGRPQEIGIVAGGEFFIIYGPPKSRKSTMMNCLTAAAYTDDPNMTLDFEFKLNDNEKFIYIDTEMPETAFHRRLMKVNRMSGFDGNDNLPFFKSYWLRGAPWYEKIEFIEEVIKQNINGLGVLLVDQVADLVPDINDRDAANDLINKIEYWTAETGCIFGSVIHTTRGTENPTGVIGAEFAKKIDSGLYIEKNMNTKNTHVKHLLSREMDIENFVFNHDENGYPHLVTDDELRY